MGGTAGETFYEVLGVSPDATRDEIEAAYREQVKETHPDVADVENGDAFRRVVRAEEVLSDPDERETYDTLGHEAYLGTVDGHDVGTDEHAPWTARDGTADADGTATDATGAESGTDAGGSDGWARQAARDMGYGDEGAGDPDPGEFDAATARRRTRNRQRRRYAAASGATGAAGTEATGSESSASTYSVHDWDDDIGERPWIEFEYTQEEGFLIATLLFLYPILLYGTFAALFAPVFNVAIGVCTLAVVMYALTTPEIGIAVFGVWSVLTPLGMIVVDGLALVSFAGIVGTAACVVPFGYSILVARVVR
ncbi:hypothetical protein BRD17_04690 [Halobacteriales archaeon SW_7_68_16]|nr:MAG: hypothetical protein BRD17_04690 [Halobacteriales archaeon SW_7_68_16]